MIFATAGHVDHGKTSLVHTLTGVDTDRLAEEKARGLSIDLGFAYWPLRDGPTIGFVDVPGHERFLRNMLAGVAGLDAALLVVAADDGPMPQTYQHLAALSIMGVEAGVVALTKCDLVTDIRIENVTRAIKKCLSATTLVESKIIPVSTVSGCGIEKLRAEIRALSADFQPRTHAGNFRMTIDRAFQMHGTGLVVTGTVSSGTVSNGDRLYFQPSGQEVRVRTIHAQNEVSNRGTAGQRVGLNVTGSKLDTQFSGRGNWLVSDALSAPTQCFDAKVFLRDTENNPLKTWTRVHLNIGTAQLVARVRPINQEELEPGCEGFAHLILNHPISALFGDRFILRNASADRIIGGGRIVDPFAEKRRRRLEERELRLAALDNPEPENALRALLKVSPRGVDISSFVLARNLVAKDAERLFKNVSMHLVTTNHKQIAFGPERWKEMGETILRTLEQASSSGSDEPGLNLAMLSHAIKQELSRGTVSVLIDELLSDSRVTFDGQYVRLPGQIRSMSLEDAVTTERVIEALKKSTSSSPAMGPLADQLAIEPIRLSRVLRRLEGEKTVVAVAANRYFLTETMHNYAESAVVVNDSSGGVLQLAEFRKSTGLSRNQAIEVLEYFDRVGFTRRVGVARIVLKDVSEVFTRPP